MPPFIIKRLPIRFAFDNNYFNDLYQGIPLGGYNCLIEKLLDGIEVKTSTDFFENRSYWNSVSKKIIFTGKIDEYFDYRYGRLEYRTVRFETEKLPEVSFQGNAVVNYTSADVPYTRIIEHKHFEPENPAFCNPVTVISKEYSSEWKDGAEPFYPINDEKNNALYQKYKILADREEKTVFGGRLAEYKYYDMDDVIKRSLDDSKIKILICCHKPSELPKDGIFLPIHCGKALSSVDLGIQGDNEVNGQPCDNISDKNETYCELTAMYWAWKNIKKIYPDIEYIGLNHYRRYFDFDHIFIPWRQESLSDIKNYRINRKKLNQKLQKPILASICRSKLTNHALWIFSAWLSQFDYIKLKNEIAQRSRKDLGSLKKIFERTNGYNACNMFVMKYDFFCTYCEWLFDILFQVEKEIPWRCYEGNQRRVMGFFGELLLSVYFDANKIRKNCIPKVFFSENKGRNDSLIVYLFKDIGKRILSFLFLYVYRRGI